METVFDGEKQDAFRPKTVYHYIQDRSLTPNIVIDVTEEYETKIEAIKAFSSQFYDPNSDEPETPISSLEFWHYIEARARSHGRLINAKYGEEVYWRAFDWSSGHYLTFLTIVLLLALWRN